MKNGRPSLQRGCGCCPRAEGGRVGHKAAAKVNVPACVGIIISSHSAPPGSKPDGGYVSPGSQLTGRGTMPWMEREHDQRWHSRTSLPTCQTTCTLYQPTDHMPLFTVRLHSQNNVREPTDTTAVLGCLHPHLISPAWHPVRALSPRSFS